MFQDFDIFTASIGFIVGMIMYHFIRNWFQCVKQYHVTKLDRDQLYKDENGVCYKYIAEYIVDN